MGCIDCWFINFLLKSCFSFCSKLNKISLGLHQENFIIRQPNIDYIYSTYYIIGRGWHICKISCCKKEKKNQKQQQCQKKQATAATINTEPACVQELAQATTTLSLGNKSGNAKNFLLHSGEGISSLPVYKVHLSSADGKDKRMTQKMSLLKLSTSSPLCDWSLLVDSLLVWLNSYTLIRK